MEPLRASVTAPAPPDRAFELFAERLGDWWPPEFSWSQGGFAADRSPQPDPDKASDVEVRFAPSDDGATRVEIEHRAWERHGDGAQEYRDGFEAAGAWPYALERFAEAAAGGRTSRHTSR